MNAASPAMIDEPPPAATHDRATAGEWLAVAAGSLGSLMASLDISIVNASLPTMQGEIGASASEGTWVATAYLVAEIIIIPLAGWFERMLGLRRFLLWAAILFTGFSVMCGTADSLTAMIIGRVGQGFTGGAMIPTAMIIIATRLPARQQPIGTAVFGSTVLLGPVLGPVVGGWLTENLSWHYAFFINVPIGVVLVALLLAGLPPRKVQTSELFEADWAGVLGMVLGLGALTVVLEEGQREQWFESALIIRLSILSAIGFLLIGWGQMRSARPVIHLHLARQRAFAAVLVMSFAGGIVLFSVPYIVPQFVATIAGYNAYQAGQVVLLIGIPALILMPMVPVIITKFDIRVVAVFGFTCVAIACFSNSYLTPDTAGREFAIPQLLVGGGQLLAFAMLNQASISSVAREDAGDASGLFNASRNLGGSVGLAVLATLRDRQFTVHRWEIHSVLDANNVALQARIDAAVQAMGGGPEALARALRMLDLEISRDALVMAFSDNFFLIGCAILLILPLTALLEPLPTDFEMSMH